MQVLLAFLPGVAEDGLGGRDAVGREPHDEGQVVVLDEAAHHFGRDDGHDDAEGVKAEEHERAVAREEGPGHEDVHGQSAGAHLAMLEAFRHPEGIRLIINEYGPADLITMQKDQPAVGIVSRKIRRAESPVGWVRPGLPRMVIYHGDADELVPFSQTEELIAELEAAEVPVELNVIEGADHGFMNQTQEVRDEIAGRICNEITAALGI